MGRVYNFCAGPATLPEEVLREAQGDLLDYQGSGMSIMEASHRGKEYAAVHEEAIANLAALLGLSDDYAVLLLQGGASGQFAMVPMNLLGRDQIADYVNTGAWASKAIKEAKTQGRVNVAADTAKDLPTRMPDPADLELTPGAAYVHITSNETIAGTQCTSFPETEAPLVADMSSDILSRPFDASRFGLIYAGAQKNLGPAGVAVVVLRKDLAARCPDTVPIFLRYATHLGDNSLYNTPPCFAIYVLALTTRWLLKQGGVEAIEARNRAKAAKLYACSTRRPSTRGTAEKDCRSDHERHLALPERGARGAVREGSDGGGPGPAQGPPLRRRAARLDLQRLPVRGRGRPGGVHEGVRDPKRLRAARIRC